MSQDIQLVPEHCDHYDDNPEPEPDILCPHSDLFLIVGPEKTSIGVDARTLRRVSKVFQAMFKPPWLESTKLSENRISPPELALPEDNFRAMYFICCIIHHRYDLLPADITAADLLQIAILVDKYDMFPAMKLATARWFKARPKSGTPEAEAILFVAEMLAAAYLFREPEHFQSLSLELLFNYSGSYREIGKTPLLVDILGYEIPVLLEERRTRIRAELQQMLIDDQKRSCDGCKYGKARAVQYAAILTAKDNAPLQTLQKPICSLVDNVEESMPSRKDLDSDLSAKKKCTYTPFFSVCRTDGRNDFSNKLKQLKADWALSYEGVRSEQAAAGNGN